MRIEERCPARNLIYWNKIIKKNQTNKQNKKFSDEWMKFM